MSELSRSVIYYDLFKEAFITYSYIFKGLRGDEYVHDASKVRRYCHTIYDTFISIKPLPPLDMIIVFLTQHVNKLPTNPSNTEFGEWNHNLKAEYIRVFGGMSPTTEVDISCAEVVVRLCRGKIENITHIFRAKSICKVFDLVGLPSLFLFNEGRHLLMSILPSKAVFTDPDNRNWKNFRTPYSMQMYLLKVRGEIASFERCRIVGEKYRAFEFAAGGESRLHDEITYRGIPDRVDVPPQTLDFKVLQTIMPNIDLMFCASDDTFRDGINKWAARVGGSIISRLRMFPFLPLSAEWGFHVPAESCDLSYPCHKSETGTRIDEASDLSNESFEKPDADVPPCRTLKTSTHIYSHDPLAICGSCGAVFVYLLVLLFQRSSFFHSVLLFQFILFVEQHWEWHSVLF
eukprot:TRINITY_DN24346_c0_g1_i1.p1 TRINITY_DN24346_c0_g1~~TRINITY_DN24346_c0_g1_i1.p1  ORF type:complete len:403 (+),score=34.85 TRINITY_DN24346_c0_g1_i1:73-1281(+)